jgi:hypothetical protein
MMDSSLFDRPKDDLVGRGISRDGRRGHVPFQTTAYEDW